jgi:hypothetical protein
VDGIRQLLVDDLQRRQRLAGSQEQLSRLVRLLVHLTVPCDSSKQGLSLGQVWDEGLDGAACAQGAAATQQRACSNNRQARQQQILVGVVVRAGVGSKAGVTALLGFS